VNDDSYELAVILASGELGKLYSGLSVLVSTAVDGGRCAALASFGALERLVDPALQLRATSERGATFGRSLGELRATALDLENLTIWACAASVETMELDADSTLAGVMSTPRFLRETASARRLLHV
jgi:peroxiredoxin family protein